jgi:putative toxin-antitoxin system antitoxin component (TIGR02293 family)
MEVASRRKKQREGEEPRLEAHQAWPLNMWSLVLPDLKGSEEPDTMDVIRQIRNGLPGSALGKVAEVYQLPQTDVYRLLKISPKTGQRAKTGKLDADKSDHVVQMIKVVMRANGIFGDHGKAMDWLKSPCYALGGQVPISLLDTTEGIELVMDTLGRIEHGVFI